MYTLKCFWAGQPVSSFGAEDNKEIDERIQDLKDQLKSGSITHTSCGKVFTLTELCVDVMKGNTFIAAHNLKA